MRALSGSVFFGVAIAGAISPARADSPPADVGDSWFALPGLHRAPLMAGSELRLSAALSAGYGLTLAEDGSHHRVAALPALGLVATPWLEFGVLGDSRYDMHPGGDTGFVSDPKAIIKVGGEVAPKLQLGGQLGGWFPGTEKAADTLDSASPEVSLFGAFLNSPLTLATYAGYRFDQSENAGRNAPRLSEGDRLALGLSEFNAVLAGLGGAYRTGSVVLIGEASAEILMGSGAPSPTQSPLRLSAGARYLASAQLQLEGMLEASLSNSPSVGPTEPLVVIEPRVSALIGLRYRFVPDPPYVPPVRPTPAAKPLAKPKPAVKVAVKTSLSVTLRGRDGELLTEAKVALTTQAGEQLPELDENGVFQFKEVEVASVTLKVTAAGYLPVTQQISLTKNAAPVELTLEASLTGQVRGLVRSFGGTPVQAKIRIQPGNLEVTSDQKGFFEVDVAPGTYEVTIEAKGFVLQQRKVNVEKDGVVVLNADLVKK